MIQGIVFDMDGVLIDSHPVHRRAWRKFLDTLGTSVGDQELDFILEGRRREEILRHFLGDIPASKIADYGHQKDQFFEQNFRDVRLIPGVRQFLTTLEAAGLETAIATSASSSRTWATLRRLELDKQFATVVTGDDVVAGKPDPAVYRLVSRRMNLCPEELLVLEDAPCGVQAAKSAGIRCIGVSTNGRAEALRQCGAEFVIPDFVDLSVEKLFELSHG
jgi:HAD superfamily hydrolase (TIGR01509 family)